MNFLLRTWIGDWLTGLGRITLLSREAIASCLTFKFSRRDLLYQIYFIGVKSQSVVKRQCGHPGLTERAESSEGGWPR